MVPQLLLITLSIILLSKPTLSSPTPLPMAIPGCDDQCGEVKIPYPFGIKEGCYLNKRFLITCNNSFTPPKPFLGDSTINVTEISLQGQLQILIFLSRQCYDQPGSKTEEIIPILEVDGFTINSTINKLVAVGCDTIGYAVGIRKNGHNYQDQIVGPMGCISLCEKEDSVINGSCSGVGCCQTSIPNGISKLKLVAGSLDFQKKVPDFNPCSYAFIVEDGKFNFTLESLMNLHSVNALPVVLDWAIGDETETCETAKQNLSSFACQNNTNCLNDQDSYFGYRCSCKDGYEGNPYLPNIGCQDMDECQKEETNNCTFKELCQNVEGDYKCPCPKGYAMIGDGKGSDGCMLKRTTSHQLLVTRILAGCAIGTAVLLVGCCWCHFRYRRIKMMSMIREGIFQVNEGISTTPQQQMTEQQNGTSNATTVRSAQKLEKSTNKLLT